MKTHRPGILTKKYWHNSIKIQFKGRESMSVESTQDQTHSYPLMSGCPCSTSAMPNPWLGQAGAMNVIPKVDILENETSVVYLFEMAGADKSQLNLEVSKSEVAVSAPVAINARHNCSVRHYQERTSGNYARILATPPNVNTEDITANFENGILEVIFPKIDLKKEHPGMMVPREPLI